TGVGASKLDWAALTSPAGATHAGLPFGLELDDALSLHVEGNATIEFEGLLTVEGSFSLDQLDVTDTALVAEVGSGGTALALSLTVAASGGGASVSGSLHLIQISNKTNPAAVRSWLGVEASELNFSLHFAPLKLAVTDGLWQLNSAPGVGASKLDWAAVTVASSTSSDPAAHHGLPFTLAIDDALSLHVAG